MKASGGSGVHGGPAWSFTQGRVGYAIGDIHGCAHLLESLLDLLEADAALCPQRAPVAIFLGDYIDRGPDARRVIDILLSGRPRGCERRFLRGNHEAAMDAFLADPWRERRWLAHGGLETLCAYDIAPPSLGASPARLEEVAGALARAFEAAGHDRFFRDLDRFAVYGDYFFAHAGVDPRRAIYEQSDHDLYWIRDRFLHTSHAFPYCVVHGHTPHDAPYADDRRVCVDLGGYSTGRLAAARFEDASLSFFEVTAAITAPGLEPASAFAFSAKGGEHG